MLIVLLLSVFGVALCVDPSSYYSGLAEVFATMLELKSGKQSFSDYTADQLQKHFDIAKRLESEPLVSESSEVCDASVYSRSIATIKACEKRALDVFAQMACTGINKARERMGRGEDTVSALVLVRPFFLPVVQPFITRDALESLLFVVGENTDWYELQKEVHALFNFRSLQPFKTVKIQEALAVITRDVNLTYGDTFGACKISARSIVKRFQKNELFELVMFRIHSLRNRIENNRDFEGSTPLSAYYISSEIAYNVYNVFRAVFLLPRLSLLYNFTLIYEGLHALKYEGLERNNALTQRASVILTSYCKMWHPRYSDLVSEVKNKLINGVKEFNVNIPSFCVRTSKYDSFRFIGFEDVISLEMLLDSDLAVKIRIQSIDNIIAKLPYPINSISAPTNYNVSKISTPSIETASNSFMPDISVDKYTAANKTALDPKIAYSFGDVIKSPLQREPSNIAQASAREYDENGFSSNQALKQNQQFKVSASQQQNQQQFNQQQFNKQWDQQTKSMSKQDQGHQSNASSNNQQSSFDHSSSDADSAGSLSSSTDKKKSKLKLYLGAGAGGAVLLIIVIISVAMFVRRQKSANQFNSIYTS